MTRQSPTTPFLFRTEKPTVISHTTPFDISSPVLDGIAIISVENEDHFCLVSANDIFLNLINKEMPSPIGLQTSNIFWGENIEDNQLQINLSKAYQQRKPLAFIWQLTLANEKHSILCKIIPLIGQDGVIGQITVNTSNYENAQNLEIEIHNYNYFDPLTGLPNRFKLLDLLEEKFFITSSAHNIYDGATKHESAILFVNVKKLQRVNESYGYEFGDEVIKTVADHLKNNLPKNAILARFANDKFIIFISEVDFNNIKQDAATLAEAIHHSFASAPLMQQSNIRLSVSIGIATGLTTLSEIEKTMQNAHLAMRKNKENSANQTIIFNEDLKIQAESKLRLETEFREALDKNALELHYQPIVNLQNGIIGGFEALARWNNSKRGNVSPLEFIALAEDAGLIIPLGEWALTTACRQIKHWIDNDPLMSNMFMAVNVSSSHIIAGNIMALTRDALAKSGLEGRSLKVEITESTIMENSDIARNILLDLKTLDISLAVDDFGTGYSSLSYLSRIPADTLKIDRSFISKIDTSDEGFNIIKVIINLAKSLGMTVIAEGIETKGQMNRLKELGCNYGQGYYFSKAIPAEQIPEFIKNHNLK